MKESRLSEACGPRRSPASTGKHTSSKKHGAIPSLHILEYGVGGTGEGTLLRIVAELADGWNATGTTPGEYEKKLKVLESYCSAVGRDVREIERSYYAPGLIAGSEKDFLQVFRKHYGQYRRPDESFEGLVQRVRGSGRSFVGTGDEVAEKVAEFSKLGVSYLMFYFPDKDPQGQLKQFAERIIPAFRDELGQ